MYAIVEIAGQQHRVAEGDRLRVMGLPKLERGEHKPGSQVTFTHVLAVGEGENMKLGRPYVQGAKIIARLEGECLGPKLVVYKYARRKKERRKTGHRQRYLEIWVQKIEIGDEKPGAVAQDEKKGD
ncbi:MAG: 50S ribosomal protein L21 [Planctomycetes bacterium]|nr:50S ribosomal protein L21 [Planctomycetota bacterium]